MELQHTQASCHRLLTPFELNHEIAATLPLDAKLTDQAEKQPASEWVETLRKHIKFMQQQNHEHQQATVQQQAKQYNTRKKTLERTSKVGDLVRPHLQRDRKMKLANIWTGQYTVVEKVGKVTNKLKKTKTARSWRHTCLRAT